MNFFYAFKLHLHFDGVTLDHFGCSVSRDSWGLLFDKLK